MMKYVIALLIGMSMNGMAQELKIGDVVPDMPFRHVINTDGGVRLSDYKGKLVILDFWSSYCAVCIAKFPELEQLQAEFPERVKIITVNPGETFAQIDKKFGHLPRFKKGAGMTSLTSVYNDTAWSFLFPHRSVPHHVWIDSCGKVMAITNGHNATPENIRKVLAGKAIQLAQKRELALDGYDIAAAGLVQPTHPDQPVRLGSVFTRYLPGVGSGSSVVEDSITYKFSIYGTSPGFLYQLAFKKSNEFKTRILFETKQKGRMVSPGDAHLKDAWAVQNRVNYELYIPREWKAMHQQYMQEDLNRYYGGLLGVHGSLEKQTFTAYVLVRTLDKAPARSKGGKGYFDEQPGKITFVDCSFNLVTEKFAQQLEDVEQGVIFLDETGLKDQQPYLLSMTIEAASLADIDKVSESLKKYGLDLIKTTREVELVVIRDLQR